MPGSESPPEGWPGWPNGKKFAFVITHDVEGIRGLDKCRMLAEMDKFTPDNLMQTWFSTGQQGADMFTKLLSGMALKPGEGAKPR